MTQGNIVLEVIIKILCWNNAKFKVLLCHGLLLNASGIPRTGCDVAFFESGGASHCVTPRQGISRIRLSAVCVVEVVIRHGKKVQRIHSARLQNPPCLTSVATDGSSEGGTEEIWAPWRPKALKRWNIRITYIIMLWRLYSFINSLTLFVEMIIQRLEKDETPVY